MNNDQYTRYKTMNNSNIKVLFKKEDKGTMHFLINGTTKYKASIYRSGKVSCSCPDFTTKHKSCSIICKHLLYLLMMYLRIITRIDHKFFSRLTLTPDEYKSSLSSFRSN